MWWRWLSRMLVNVSIADKKEAFKLPSFLAIHREIFQAASNRAGTDKALNHARSWVERFASNWRLQKSCSVYGAGYLAIVFQRHNRPGTFQEQGAWRHLFERTYRAESKVEYGFGSGRTYSLLDGRPGPRQRATRQAGRSIKADSLRSLLSL
jgi:hypothetical protein